MNAGPKRHSYFEYISARYPITGDIVNDLSNLHRLYPYTRIDPKYLHQLQSDLIETDVKRLSLDYDNICYRELEDMVFSLFCLPLNKQSRHRLFAEALQLCAAQRTRFFKEALSIYVYYWHIDIYNQIRYLHIDESSRVFELLMFGGIEIFPPEWKKEDEEEDYEYLTEHEISCLALEDALLSIRHHKKGL